MPASTKGSLISSNHGDYSPNSKAEHNSLTQSKSMLQQMI